ncbi:MAG TPA: alpha/beta fold hydrolase [Mycobacteriales bacterium]|nr:alpha/beta fold hydrolase [Mycobacteriales bacterium]
MTARTWPKAYGPLRPRTLLWQLAVLVVAEIALYASYATHEARFHWATHFLVGLTVAALWRALFLLVAARPTRFQLLSILGFHLWAMWPDIVFRAPGVPHYHWMDWLALGHVSSHYMPGGDTTWLLVALAASGAYAVLLWRWLSARHTEAAAGLAPALGVGGSGVLRPQLDPTTTVLAHETCGAPDSAGEPLVFLHGLGATSSTWVPTAQRVAVAGVRSLVPDLLGFGSSMRIGTAFGLDAQADAVIRLLDHHDVQRAHLVAHSWGSALAAAVVERAPERVARMTLVAPAVFADVDSARARFSERSWLARATLAGSPLGGFVCGAMCLARPLVARLAPRMEPDVPPEVARDGVQHSFAAYSDALNSMWEGNPLAEVLRRPPCPITVLLAEQDRTVLPSDVLDLPPSADVRIVRTDGDHGIAYTQPDLVATLLLEQLDSRAHTRGAVT